MRWIKGILLFTGGLLFSFFTVTWMYQDMIHSNIGVDDEWQLLEEAHEEYIRG